MKQLLIISGKGGTGKTTVAAAFVKLGGIKAAGDCDVDAPNLHFLVKPENAAEKKDYYGLAKAYIDCSKCVNCGLCAERCRFGAVYGPPYRVDSTACEGCAVCMEICPAKAVSLIGSAVGELSLYKGETVFSTAELKTGGGNSGKLVAEVKKQLAGAVGIGQLAVIDGPPGIGCPVIASLSGVDLALIVTEPSLSGQSDMQRIVNTAKQFGTSLAVCVNKADVNCEITQKIISYCETNAIPFAGTIPYDKAAVSAVNAGHSLAEAEGPAQKAVKYVYEKVMELLEKR